jgi:hypothetical protein
MMTLREKILYHQIHPLKLAVDISSALFSTWLMWRHELWVAMVVAWLPAILVSAAMLRWMDFSRQRDSAFGRYVAFHMTHVAEAVRMSGQIVMWIAAWYRAACLIAVGFAIVVFGWTYSLPAWRACRSR